MQKNFNKKLCIPTYFYLAMIWKRKYISVYRYPHKRSYTHTHTSTCMRIYTQYIHIHIDRERDLYIYSYTFLTYMYILYIQIYIFLTLALINNRNILLTDLGRVVSRHSHFQGPRTPAPAQWTCRVFLHDVTVHSDASLPVYKKGENIVWL